MATIEETKDAVLVYLAKNLDLRISIASLQKALEQEFKVEPPSYATVFRAIGDLADAEGLVKKTEFGGLILLELNVSNPSIDGRLAGIEAKKFNDFLKTLDGKVKDAIELVLPSFVNPFIRHVTIFGSYAKGTQTKISDIDLFIVWDLNLSRDEINECRKNIDAVLRSANDMYGVRFQPFFMRAEDFRNYRSITHVSGQATLGHIIICGWQSFWQDCLEWKREELRAKR